MFIRSVRRSAAIIAFGLLTLSLVLGTTSASAKPGASNSLNAKLCQKGGYLTLARPTSPGTAFASEAECTSFAAQGGVLTAYVPAPSAGCTALAGIATGRYYSVDLVPLSFLAGERITVVATDPAAGTTGVTLLINRVAADGSATLPAELSYDIPTDGTYAVMSIVAGGAGNALMDFGCVRP